MVSSAPVAVIGATGTTGTRIVHDLNEAGVPVRAGSRSGPVRFDWNDERTFEPFVSGAGAVYVIAPVGDADPAPVMRTLVTRAFESGVPRLVLHSATIVEPGSPGIGEIHTLIADTAPEWAVLRPSWFMQNLQPGHGHYLGDEIGAHGRIVTSVGDGAIAFVDAGDIAAVAVRALIDPHPHQCEYVVTGPTAVTYDEVAAVISDVSGRRIVHDRVGRDVVEALMIDHGMPPAFAHYLAGLEDELREGSGSD